MKINGVEIMNPHERSEQFRRFTIITRSAYFDSVLQNYTSDKITQVGGTLNYKVKRVFLFPTFGCFFLNLIPFKFEIRYFMT